MKIALVRRGFSAGGGAERYLSRVAAGLRRVGHDPVLVGDVSWPEDRWDGESEVIDARGPWDFAEQVARRMDRAVWDSVFSLERIFFCHAYRAGDGVHRAWMKRRQAGGSGAWRTWFRGLRPKHKQLLALEKRLFGDGGARRIIVNSRMVAAEITAEYGVADERIHLVYNGYDPGRGGETVADREQARGSLRKAMEIPEDALVILFTGSGWERKGLDFLVRALDRLNRRNIHLIVAGRGRMRRGYAGDRRHFLGTVAHMPPLYAAADLFVLPTLYDPFSNACLEAMRHGLPVVTTTANGFAEIGCDGVHGEAVAAGDVAALTSALDRWTSPDFAPPAREACTEKVSHLTIEANVRQTLEVLEAAARI